MLPVRAQWPSQPLRLLLPSVEVLYVDGTYTTASQPRAQAITSGAFSELITRVTAHIAADDSQYDMNGQMMRYYEPVCFLLFWGKHSAAESRAASCSRFEY